MRVYPNGEFGVGFLPKEKKRVEDKRQERGEIEGCTTELVLAPDIVLSKDGTTATYTRVTEERLTPKLGIGAELSQPRKKYGLKGITAYGRKMLRNAGHVIDVYTRNKWGALPQMGTLTIPSLSPDQMRTMAVRWAYIQKRFFEKCRRRYVKLGLRFHYASCTEIQPGRWNERGEIGLHIHFLFIAHRLAKRQWSLPDQWVRNEWKRTLESVLGENTISGNLNYRREAVNSSSAAYLAKYASKGTEFIREVSEAHGGDVLPSQWWSASTTIRGCIKAHVQVDRGGRAESLAYICSEGMVEYYKYVREAKLDASYYDFRSGQVVSYSITLGYGGMLTSRGRSLFQPTDLDRSIAEYLSVPLTIRK